MIVLSESECAFFCKISFNYITSHCECDTVTMVVDPDCQFECEYEFHFPSVSHSYS